MGIFVLGVSPNRAKIPVNCYFFLEMIKMTRLTRIGFFVLIVCFVFAASCGANTGKVKPLEQLQSEFLQLKFGMFLHFNMATFNRSEWASGKEGPQRQGRPFNIQS